MEGYAASTPVSQEKTRDGQPVQVSRGETRLFVVYRPGEGLKGQLSFTAGYPLVDRPTRDGGQYVQGAPSQPNGLRARTLGWRAGNEGWAALAQQWSRQATVSACVARLGGHHRSPAMAELCRGTGGSGGASCGPNSILASHLRDGLPAPMLRSLIAV